MGRKRKALGGLSQSKGPREYDPADARLGPVNSYRDLADDQDQYFLNRDEILFDDAPKSKRQKSREEEDAFFEASDDEILDFDEQESDDDPHDPPKPSKRGSNRTAGAGDDDDDDDDGDDQQEGEGDMGWWGSSRKEYYDADRIETENDAVEEENEARRLQKKKLAKMVESDYFNENEWLAPDAGHEEQDEVVTEVLRDLPIPSDMRPEEKYQLLRDRYPELPLLADELVRLQPLLVSLQHEAQGQSSRSLQVVKYRILGCYVAAMAMYFATLTAPARDKEGATKPLDPADLREHEVMDTLLHCREAWERVQNLAVLDNLRAGESLSSPRDDAVGGAQDNVQAVSNSTTKPRKRSLNKEPRVKANRSAKTIEDSLADLDSLLIPHKKPKNKTAMHAADDGDDKSDFGEEESLDAQTAADKAARKKSLRFYTSQIVQKANRRADAGRDAGGDNDIPYRERLRDRQARLNAEAEKRGKDSSKYGADLGASDDEDDQVALAVREKEDEYYDMIAAASSKKKDGKAARAAAVAAASSADRIVEKEEMTADGHRKITYAIEKNKGLAPRRKKDVRNPRVKKKKKYEQAQKKLRSMKATYRGGEGRGYAGETSGIKPGLIKSVKL
ncbi:Sas10 C-terminal domain-containing protein [Xylariomycetidae sp. FL2044]|nr:Sas10 C-terminal domain-containing protein [Xylariomycetidae sp. FL2044]